MDALRQQIVAEPSNVEPRFELAKMHFEAADYAECRRILKSALTLSTISPPMVKKINMWIRKCDTHLPAEPEEGKAEPTLAAPAEQPAVEAPPAPAPVPAVKKPPTAVRFEWFQTPKSVTFTFFVQGRSEEDLKIVATPTSLEVTIILDRESGRDWQYHIDNFFAPIVPGSVKKSLRPLKIELTYEKEREFQWPALEGKEGPIPVAVPAAIPATQQDLKYPNSKGKDWNKFKLEEEEEKKEGEAGLNDFFKKIYADADEDQRRAMMKSFQESGGTVLSTNWKDIGTKKVECEPPKGMEAHKYEY